MRLCCSHMAKTGFLMMWLILSMQSDMSISYILSNNIFTKNNLFIFIGSQFERKVINLTIMEIAVVISISHLDHLTFKLTTTKYWPIRRIEVMHLNENVL